MGIEMRFTFGCDCRRQMNKKAELLSLLAGKCLICGTPMKEAQK